MAMTVAADVAHPINGAPSEQPAQPDDYTRALELYRQGRFADAAALLESGLSRPAPGEAG